MQIKSWLHVTRRWLGENICEIWRANKKAADEGPSWGLRRRLVWMWLENLTSVNRQISHQVKFKSGVAKVLDNPCSSPCPTGGGWEVYRHGLNQFNGFSHAWTNRWNKGLISVDRRAKPTLVLTIPRSLCKSSAKDLSFSDLKLWLWYDVGLAPTRMHVTPRKVDIVAFPAWILT